MTVALPSSIDLDVRPDTLFKACFIRFKAFFISLRSTSTGMPLLSLKRVNFTSSLLSDLFFLKYDVNAPFVPFV